MLALVAVRSLAMASPAAMSLAARDASSKIVHAGAVSAVVVSAANGATAPPPCRKARGVLYADTGKQGRTAPGEEEARGIRLPRGPLCILWGMWICDEHAPAEAGAPTLSGVPDAPRRLRSKSAPHGADTPGNGRNSFAMIANAEA